MITAKEFLTENKQQVIDFYNKEITNFWNVSLKDFMLDLLNNFKKNTTGDEFKKYDLFSNLAAAKSRLGCWEVKATIGYSKPYSESNHAKLVNYHGKEKANFLMKSL
jgi:hypothetical protein